jgi:hypothetical protein
MGKMKANEYHPTIFRNQPSPSHLLSSFSSSLDADVSGIFMTAVMLHPTRPSFSQTGAMVAISQHALSLITLDPVFVVDVAPDALEIEAKGS